MKEKDSKNINSFNPILIKTNLDNWVKALNAGDIKQLTALYHDQVKFFPTFSKELKKGKKGANSYFQHFLLKKPKCQILTNEVQPLSETSYFQTGFYEFCLYINNVEQIGVARFTFIWDGDKIMHHHSSMNPE